MTAHALSVSEVSVSYGRGAAEVRALDAVDLCVRRGEVLALMGPSGSGKTTLLMVMGCLLSPTRGRVAVEGNDVQGLSDRALSRLRLQRIGFVFQSYNLFPALKAVENIRVALELKRRDVREAEALLDRVGLTARAGAFPAELSGGEKQRVAIARALAGDPGIILADEPTAALDSTNGRLIVSLLRDLAVDQDRAVVIVTHDSRVADAAHRVVRLEDGRVVE